MAPHLSLPQLAAVPHRQYAQPGGMHVSLGWPIRLIAGAALTLILGLAVLALFGWPTPDRLAGVVVFAIGIVIISVLVVGIRVAAQWEQGVVLRLGRFAGLRGPGLLYIIPGVEHVLFVDRRLLTLDIPGQKAITKDNVPVQIDGALFFQVHDPARAMMDVQDYRFATAQYAQAALRDTIGGLSLDELGSSPSNTVILMPAELVELVSGVRAQSGNGAAEDTAHVGRQMAHMLAER